MPAPAMDASPSTDAKPPQDAANREDAGVSEEGGAIEDASTPADAAPPDAAPPEDLSPPVASTEPVKPPNARVWGRPGRIAEAELAYMVQVATNAAGDAVLAWDQLDGEVMASVYDAASAAWTMPHRLDREDNPDDSAIPDVAMDAMGNAIAVWQRQSPDNERLSIWTSRYTKATRAWSPAQQIAGSEQGGIPQVVVNQGGDATLVFSALGSLTAVVSTARAPAATGAWGETGPVATPPTLHSLGAFIAMEPGGNAAVIWTSRNITTSFIYVARYNASTGRWGESQALTPELEFAQATGIAINPSGTAFASWVQGSGDDIQVWSSRSPAAGMRWTPAVRIDTPGGGAALLPEIAVDAKGNALAVWSADDFTRQNVFANRFTAADGKWGKAEIIDADDFDAMVARIGMDSEGNALVLWTRDDDIRKEQWGRWFDASTGTWGTGKSLELTATGDSEYGQVAVAPTGQAFAAWSRGGKAIYASFCR